MVPVQVLIFLLILSVLVIIHELGHFVAAKMIGARVEEFGFGLPPKALKLFTWKGTEFSLNWLPIGGFVRLYGEDFDEAEEMLPKISDRFYDKPAWQRAIVLTAGVIMNFVLGVLLFAAVYSYLGIPTKTSNVHIEEVAAESPAEKAGFKAGMQVTKWQLGDQTIEVKSSDQLVKMTNENKGKEINLTVKAEGTEKVIKVVPRENPPAGQGALGLVLSDVELVKYPWWQMPFRGVVVGLNEAIAWGREIASGTISMLWGLVTGKGIPKDVSGPVGIYQVSAQVAKVGLIATLQFMGVLSINLAILNILPLPALDGGRVVFLGVEKIIGKKLKNRIEGYVHSAGMVVLLGLMLLITIRDVLRLLGKVK